MKSVAWRRIDALVALAQGWRTSILVAERSRTRVYSVLPETAIPGIKSRAEKGCETCQKAVHLLILTELSGHMKTTSKP